MYRLRRPGRGSGLRDLGQPQAGEHRLRRLQAHPVPSEGVPGLVQGRIPPVAEQPEVQQRPVSAAGAEQGIRRLGGEGHNLTGERQL